MTMNEMSYYWSLYMDYTKRVSEVEEIAAELYGLITDTSIGHLKYFVADEADEIEAIREGLELHLYDEAFENDACEFIYNAKRDLAEYKKASEVFDFEKDEDFDEFFNEFDQRISEIQVWFTDNYDHPYKDE